MKVVHFPFTSRNPYQTLLVGSLKELGLQVAVERTRLLRFLNITIVYMLRRNWKPDVLHLHWHHSSLNAKSKIRTIFKSLFFISQLLMVRLLGIKLAWTIHNIREHDKRHIEIELFFSKLLACMMDALIVHCESAKAEVMRAYTIPTSKKIHVIPHGNYFKPYRNTIPSKIAKEMLKLPEDAVIFLMIGELRKYKGIDNLIHIFKKVSITANQRKKLIIVGRPENEIFDANIRMLAEKAHNIVYIPGSVAEDEMQIYFNAADIVVFPYKNILTSGAVLLALTFGKPIIAPKIGCIKDILDASGSFLYEPYEKNGLYESMMNALENKANLRTMSAHNLQLAHNIKWTDIAKATFEVYQGIMGKAKF